MPYFTVFCRDPDDANSTIWISTVEANNSTDAIQVGRDACAEDWNYTEQSIDNELDDSCGHINDIVVLGVAEGNINILEWADSGLKIPNTVPTTPPLQGCVDRAEPTQ